MNERADGDGGGEKDAGTEGPAKTRPRRRVHEERLGRKRPGSEARVPAWIVVPLATGAGALVSGWPGAVFGLLAGLALWWGRR